MASLLNPPVCIGGFIDVNDGQRHGRGCRECGNLIEQIEYRI